MIESTLIEKCKTGDGQAFRRLINIYRKRLLGYFWRYSETQFDTEEMLQETLIKVWNGLSKYNHQKKFSSWLFTIAHNVAVDFVRQRKNNSVSIDSLIEQKSSSNTDEIIIKEETEKIINNAISTLSEKQREVFFLRQHGDLTFKEISKAMNEPLNTVISHMHYAIKKIRKQLELKNESKSVI